MKTKFFTVVVLLLGFAIFVPLNADTTLRKTTGEEIRGDLIKFENNTVTMRTPGGEIRIPLSDLDDKSKYLVQKQFIETDRPDLHIKLADFCIEKQLYEEAIAEIINAGDISDKILERAYHMLLKARLLHAESLRNDAKKKYEDKQFLDALIFYKKLYKEYPDAEDKEKTAKEIKRLQALIGRPDDVLPKQDPMPSLLLKNFEPNKPNKNDDNDEDLSKSDKKKLENEEAKLAYCDKLINEGWELRKNALIKNSTSEFQQKWQDYKDAEGKINDAMKLLDEIIQNTSKYSFMKDVEYNARKAKSGATDRMIEIARDVMHLYLDSDQPELRKGLVWLNKVLAYAPFDEEARDLRKTITESLLIEARK